MDQKSVLGFASFLSRDLNRDILKSLLKNPKDMRTLCRDIHRKRSTIFDALKEMEEAGVIQSKKVKTPGRGRNKKEYTVKEFYMPEITRETLLDFLEGKDVKAKSMDSSDMALIAGFSQIAPVSSERIFDLLLSSGVDLKYVLQILLDLASEFQTVRHDGIPEEKEQENITESVSNLYRRIVEIMRVRYPIRSEVVEKFIEISKEEIILTSESGAKVLSLDNLAEIAADELLISDYEAQFVAAKVLHMLKSTGLSTVSLAIVVDLMYSLSQNLKIDCRKPKFYLENPTIPEFRGYDHIVIRDGSLKKKWSAPHIADYLSRRLRLKRESSLFVAKILLDKLKYVNLGSYDISFIESLATEILLEHNI
jgi:predicted transcriptional regulator